MGHVYLLQERAMTTRGKRRLPGVLTGHSAPKVFIEGVMEAPSA